jgi:hypothetical protein
MNKRTIIAIAAGAAALFLPAAASADPGHGRGKDKSAAAESVTTHGKGAAKKAKKVTFVFKGTFTADGTVTVSSGNAHVRRGGFVRQSVAFDLSGARIVVADTNADQTLDLADVQAGDRVVVKARLAKGTKYVAAAEGQTAEQLVASRLIDKTHVADDEVESTDD